MCTYVYIIYIYIYIYIYIFMGISYYIPILNARLCCFCNGDTVSYISWCFLVYACIWVQDWICLIIFFHYVQDIVCFVFVTMSGTHADVSNSIHAPECRNVHFLLYSCTKSKTLFLLYCWQCQVHKLMFTTIFMHLSTGIDIFYYIPVLSARSCCFCIGDNIRYTS